MSRVRRALRPAAWLAVSLLGAWIVLAATFAIVAATLAQVAPETLAEADRAVLSLFHEIHHDPWLGIARKLSWLGKPQVTVPLLWGIGIGLLVVGERRGALHVLVRYVGAGDV